MNEKDNSKITVQEIFDVYFSSNNELNKKFENLIIFKLTPLVINNLYQSLNNFLFHYSYKLYNDLYKDYFTYPIDNQYKKFFVAACIKDNNFYPDTTRSVLMLSDPYLDMLRSKVIVNDSINKSNIKSQTNYLYYDLFNIAYNVIHNYFYEQSLFLVPYTKDIYNKLVKLTFQLLDNINEKETLTEYFNKYINQKYMLVLSTNNHDNTLSTYTSFIDAINHMKQYINFEFKDNNPSIINCTYKYDDIQLKIVLF